MKYTKDFRLTYTEKAEKIVSKLSLEEKVGLMGGNVELETMISSFNDPNSHYNIEPYLAGGIKNIMSPQCYFAMDQEALFVELGKQLHFLFQCLEGHHSIQSLRKE